MESKYLYKLEENYHDSKGGCGLYIKVINKNEEPLFVKIIDKKEKYTENEILILKRLKEQNENMINLENLLEFGSNYYIVTKYCKNGDFFDYFIKTKTKDKYFFYKTLTQMIDCVYNLHKLKISHRDIKLENFLVDNNGNLMLTDFGFSTLKECSDEKIGTEDYCSPELIDNEWYNCKKNDIYSLGVTLIQIFFMIDLEDINKDDLIKYKLRFYTGNQDFRLLAIDLFKNMISPEKKRYSIFEVRRHACYKYCRDALKLKSK